MPADRPQRAEHTEREIEAVYVAMYGEPGERGMDDDLREHLELTIAALDRARDARSDEPRVAGEDHVALDQALQGEDHQAGIEAAADAVYGEFIAGTSGPARPSYSDLAKAAVDAYVSRMPPARDARSDERPLARRCGHARPDVNCSACAADAFDALDRARDARSDEGPTKIPPLCDRCGGDHYITEHDTVARPPQAEDNEDGIKAKVCECGATWFGGNEKYCPRGHAYRFRTVRYVRARDARSDEEAGRWVQPEAFCEQPSCQAKNDGSCHVPEDCGHFQPKERWVQARSPQGEDHEAQRGMWYCDDGRNVPPPARDARSDTVAWSQLREAARRYVDETRGLGERPDIDEMFDVLMDEFEQCARSDTVAVEDVLAVVRELAEPPMMSDAYPQLWARINRARAALAEFGGRAATDDQA